MFQGRGAAPTPHTRHAPAATRSHRRANNVSEDLESVGHDTLRVHDAAGRSRPIHPPSSPKQLFRSQWAHISRFCFVSWTGVGSYESCWLMSVCLSRLVVYLHQVPYIFEQEVHVCVCVWCVIRCKRRLFSSQLLWLPLPTFKHSAPPTHSCKLTLYASLVKTNQLTSRTSTSSDIDTFRAIN